MKYYPAPPEDTVEWVPRHQRVAKVNLLGAREAAAQSVRFADD